MEMIIKCNDQDIGKLFKKQFPDMDKIREEFWRENENGKLKDEIQDLKLEIDRLQKREDLYQKYLNMFDCREITCVRCIQYRPGDDVPCNLALPQYRHKLINDLKKKLEDL